MAFLTDQQLNDMLKPLLQKDLRIQARARGLNPGGSREALFERVKEHMMETKDYTIFPDPEGVPIQSGGDAGFGKEPRPVSNNYTRPNGEINSSNFLTDRPSSRVLAPPGGGSNVHLG